MLCGSREFLPFFWHGRELKLLKPTAVIDRADCDLDDLKDDYANVVVNLSLQQYYLKGINLKD